MLQNYLKIAWRNLIRNRGYAVINIMGLAIGLACFMFISLYVRDEISYDKFHPDGDRVYRMSLERIYPGRTREYAVIPHSYAEVAAQDFPEIEAVCRLFFFPGNNLDLRVNDQRYDEEFFVWADSTFFDVFGIPLLAGDPETCLSNPNGVVLTESLAKRYFGNERAIGKRLQQTPGQDDLVVTGVCGDVPENSHIKFNLLLSTPGLGFIQQPNFINFSAYTYLKLVPGADPEALESKFPEWITGYISGQALQRFGVNYEEYQAQGNGYRYFLQNLPGIYLNSNLEAEMKPPGSKQRIYFFTLIAILIIGIAAINFMNLATARSAGRAREVGIRKTLGSTRPQIAGQFLTEAIIIAFVAGTIAWGLNSLLLPRFNMLSGKTFEPEVLVEPNYLLLLITAAAITGLLSGVYPAMALSSFRPVEVLKGKIMSTAKGAGLRNALVVFQFGISVFLIISTILVYQQWSFTQNKELGFDKESLVNLQGAGGLTAQQEETFKNQLRALPGVVAVSGCSQEPGSQYFGLSFTAEGTNESVAGSGLIVDEGYIECMRMQIVEGRSFSDDFMDTLSLVINQAAQRELGLDNAIGARVISQDAQLNPDPNAPSVYTIVGIVEDFHFQSLHHVISPVYIIHNQRGFTPGVDPVITVRMAASATTNTLQEIESLWNTYQPDAPFRYAFLDQQWAALYEKEMTTRKIASIFSLIAIFIACLGLLALAAFTAERKTKEIGIRKVLGATVPGIVGMLSKDFIRLVLIGVLIASPIAWFVMNRWLQDFVYRIQIHWSVFVIAAFLAMAIAFLTVCFQSLKAATTNPITSLRDE